MLHNLLNVNVVDISRCQIHLSLFKQLTVLHRSSYSGPCGGYFSSTVFLVFSWKALCIFKLEFMLDLKSRQMTYRDVGGSEVCYTRV